MNFKALERKNITLSFVNEPDPQYLTINFKKINRC